MIVIAEGGKRAINFETVGLKIRSITYPFMKTNGCKPLCSEDQDLDPRILNMRFSVPNTQWKIR